MRNLTIRHLLPLFFMAFLVLTLASCGGEEEKPPEAPPEPAASAEPVSPVPAPISPAVIQTPKPARMVVRPNSLRLGPVLPGATDTKSITVTNEGEDALTIREIRLDADQTELTLGGSCLSSMPKILLKSESCDVTAIFAPVQPGGDVVGEIVVTPESFDNVPAYVTLTASRAVPPPEPPPMVFGPSPALEAAIQVAQQRSGGRMTVLDEKVSTGNDIVTKDLDYTPIGFAPTVSTLPVDRSRMITADKYINAVLENTINSQLAGGRIVGVIEQHVYGGDGRYVLLPAGSRAIGVYESLARQGDTRLRASFVRVMRPDGAAIAIEGDPAADVMGRLGLIGDVDNRYFDRFAGPLLISLIGAIGTYATSPDTIINTDSVGNTSTTQTLTPEQQAYQNFANDLSFITQRLVEENLNLAPIITIPGGSRFVILPTRDIVLQGYSLVAADRPHNNADANAQQVAGATNEPQPPAPPVNNRPGAAQPGYVQ